MTRTLVIGGNRFVGNKLVKSLLSQSHVTVFNRSGTGPI
jgi:nucleoside-diphosphate-sugar epimerase